MGPGDGPARARPHPATIGELVAELKRRRVFRAMVGYGIFSLAALQVAEPLLHGLHLSEWWLTAVIVALAVGFPIATVLAWLFDLTARGVRRTPPAVRAGGVRLSRRRLGVLLAAAGVAGALPAAGWYLWRQSGERDGGAPGTGAAPSIAVLPFADMSPQHDQEYFSDGVAEEILNALSRVEGLKVIGRTSSFSFKGRSDNLRVIAQKLGVGAVLEGSVRKSGNRIRVTAQLIQAGDGSHLWSETFDRNLADVFAIQDEISRDVVRALRVRLFPDRSSAWKGTRATSTEVYNEFLRGRDFLRVGTVEDTARAVAAYERALSLDPTYAPAWAELSVAFLNLEMWSAEANPGRRRRAREAADRAMELAPELAEGPYARAWVRLYLEWDLPGALADVERAFALNPSMSGVESQRGRLLIAVGRREEAVASARRGVDLDPLSAWAWWSLAVVHAAAGDGESEREALERALAVAPGHLPARSSMAWNLVRSGKPAEALAFVGTDRPEGPLPVVAVAQHELGRVEESRATLDRLIARDPRGQAYGIAIVLAWRGDRDGAFEWLERAFVERKPGLVHAGVDPGLLRLREDPRWKPFLRKVGLPTDGTSPVPPPAP